MAAEVVVAGVLREQGGRLARAKWSGLLVTRLLSDCCFELADLLLIVGAERGTPEQEGKLGMTAFTTSHNLLFKWFGTQLCRKHGILVNHVTLGKWWKGVLLDLLIGFHLVSIARQWRWWWEW